MLVERYRLLEPIGRGVSAVVHRALDTRTGGIVAVKMLAPHLAADEVGLERFRREIRIARFLGHPQVVSIYDLVVADGHVCLVMEYVPGDDLKRLVLRRGPLAVETVIDVLAQTLSILAVCHGKRVIHRDLKPQNVLVTPAGDVKPVDFGVARVSAASDLTQTGTALGSAAYMAPEQLVSSNADLRSDLYALGVVFYEL